MSSPSASPPPPGVMPAGVRPKRRRGGTVADMARSLLLVVPIIVVLVVLHGHQGGPAVRTVDPAPAYAGASHVAGYPLQVPQNLPRQWRCTSVRSATAEGRLTLTVGFVTPRGDFASLTESDRPRADVLHDLAAPDPQPRGATPVAGVDWQRYPSAKAGETVLARTAGRVTYAVTGSAATGELVTLGSSLRPLR